MRSAATFLVPVFLLLQLPAAGHAEMSPEKEKTIRKLMEITGAADLGKQMSAALMAQLQPTFPEVPEEVWKEFSASLQSGEVEDLVIPVYDRHFTMVELEALIDFYSSPIGRRVVEKLPLVMQESMAAGQQWGQAKAQEIVQRLIERGYEPAEI